MARYILSRLAEEYGTVACFDPQPVPDWPGNGTFCYFSSKDMREEDGILWAYINSQNYVSIKDKMCHNPLETS